MKARTTDLELVSALNYREKVSRSLALLWEARRVHGDGLVVAHSLGKDSCAVWDLARQVDPAVRGFIITTRYKPEATKAFMRRTVEAYPGLSVYSNDDPVPEGFFRTDPDACCDRLKVEPTRRALLEMGATCWVTGLRCTEGRTRTGLSEIEERDQGLIKLNPILLWEEREVWQYLALNRLEVNPLYGEGYRSLGCAPCTEISQGDERSGRWKGTVKMGGECGIHTRALIAR